MKSIRKAMHALDLIGPDRPELSVGDAARALALPRSSVSRLLGALGECGLLSQDPETRRYRPGPLAARLGSLYAADDLIETARRGARALASETGHSTWVAALNGREIAVLDNVHGRHPVRFVVEPGASLPAHTTAIGKALLAELSDEEFAALYPDPALPAATPSSLTNLQALLGEIDEVRARGYGVSDQENFPGIKSYAVVLKRSGERTLGLGLSFPLAAADAQGEEYLLAAMLRHGRGVA